MYFLYLPFISSSFSLCGLSRLDCLLKIFSFCFMNSRFKKPNHVVPQILVVDPHNGGSWECMANMVNEESRPFLCPGIQVFVFVFVFVFVLILLFAVSVHVL